jgi:UDP-N-acetylmuramate dehydrogenase
MSWLEAAIAAQLRGEWREQESLAAHTSWRVGGPAAYYYRPADLADLAYLLPHVPPSLPILFLGLGSNVLISDTGIPGLVIHLYKTCEQLQLLEQDASRALYYAEAGLTCARLGKLGQQAALEGSAFFAGIPGTLGGALAMNAGAFGSDTWQTVCEVATLNRQGQLHWFPAGALAVAYRWVALPPETWFVAAKLQFTRSSDAAAAQQAVPALLAKRRASQPIGTFSCGSVFKNPPNDHAARLIEQCGLKGQQVGHALVSPKHANFIINEAGRASASEILALIQLVQSTVLQQTGISLELEVKILP